MTRAELKAESKKQLRGNWGWAAWLGIVTAIIYDLFWGQAFSTVFKAMNSLNDAMGSASTASIFEPELWAGRIGRNSGVSFLGGFFLLSLTITFLRFTEGHKYHIVNGLFSVFTEGRFVPEFLNYLLSSIFQFLWTLLLVIPGIVKSYSYALTPYIVSDMVKRGEEVHATSGISESRRLMNGHKWELFVLNLSFIGWEILAILSFGIGFIWLVPYEQTTKANFYRNIIGDQLDN